MLLRSMEEFQSTSLSSRSSFSSSPLALSSTTITPDDEITQSSYFAQVNYLTIAKSEDPDSTTVSYNNCLPTKVEDIDKHNTINDNNNDNNNIICNINNNRDNNKNNTKNKYRGSCNESIRNSIKGLINNASLFPFPPIVKRLIRLKIENIEDKWNEKAVRGLVRRLKQNLGSLEELERSIIEQNPNTKCVTIARSLDGRLQVSERKGLPHVIYCQLWRWPDLQSHHQIKGIESCLYPFHLKLKLVCINPYHYERIGEPTLPAIMVPRTTAAIPHELAQAYEDFSHSLGDNLETVSMDIINDQLMHSDNSTPTDRDIKEVNNQEFNDKNSSSSKYANKT